MSNKEFDSLLLKLTEGSLEEAERARLEELIRKDDALRLHYLSYLEVDAMLKWRSGGVRDIPVTSDELIRMPAPRSTMAPVLRIAAAFAITTGLGLFAWKAFRGGQAPSNIVIEGPTPVEGPTLATTPIASMYAEPVTLKGWQFFATTKAQYEITGEAEVRLDRGELYAASQPIDGDRPPLNIHTPAGTATATGTRFFVSTDPQEPTMKPAQSAIHLTRVLVMTGVVSLSNPLGAAEAAPGDQLTSTTSTAPKKLLRDGNYREALDIYEKLVVDPAHKGQEAADDLMAARQCMLELNRIDLWDELAEQSIQAHPKDWRVLHAAAIGYHNNNGNGFMVGGVFSRGWHIRDGRHVDVTHRDRIRALQLMQQAAPLIGKDDDPKRVAGFYQDYATVLRSGGASWRLQMLTDIDHLPAHDDPAPFGRISQAPVGEDNKPVWYSVPKSWKAANNDGERWRWLMHKADEVDPDGALANNLVFAEFLHHQFGVQTMGSLIRHNEDDQPDGGLYTVHTLKDTQTLARLATGVQRLTLPDEFNFVKRYRDVADVKVPETPSPISDLKYSYYEGNWNKLPDFRELKAKTTGEVKDGRFDVALSPREDYFGLVWEGTLNVPKDGTYTFSINSDDGSALKVGEDFELRHDGLHGMDSAKSGKAKLKKGEVPIRLELFEKAGGQGLRVSWKSPDMDLQYLSVDRHVTPQELALNALAGVYENRRQYGRAAEVWKENIARFGPGENNQKKKRLAQILDDWGRLETQGMHPAGKMVNLGFSFRNAKEVSFTAHKVKLDVFMNDIKAYLKTDPERLDYGQTNPDQLGHRLVTENEDKYLGAQTAAWDLALKPAKDHGDRRIEVKTPLNEAGVYLVNAKVGGGQESLILVWITDTVIVDRPTNNNHHYFVADAKTGRPVEGATLEFFGYRQSYESDQERYRTYTTQFAEKSNADGWATPERATFKERYQWLVTATDPNSTRLAVLGFTGAYFQPLQTAAYNQAKAYVVTDRPLYRPGQPVEISAWVRQARYDLDDVSRYAGREFFLRLRDPQGKQLFEKKFKADTYGDFDLKWSLPEDAKLGRYQLQVIAKNMVDPATGKTRKTYYLGSLDFQVEEYKKPEYEVAVDAPTEPVTLGDRIEATIKAKYYFGAPVTNAKVKYTVRRSDHHDSWIPPRPWDWFYGPGYGWLAEARDWYPGFDRWGCRPPGWFHPGRPEVIQERTVAIGPDGTVKVQIDTAVAKALHGDIDHHYEITAEVVDESRRTIVGKGAVIAARDPYKVYAWLNQGHYAVGEVIKASFQARTPDGKPVQGAGKVVLHKITYDENGEPKEEAAGNWKVSTDAEGHAELDIKAHTAGQHRVAYTMVDKKGNEREGAVIVVVRGKGFDGSGFRFNDLEITADKAEYKAGDRVNLMVSTARKNSTVALFVRPVNGVYPKASMIRLKGKSQVHAFDITQGDTPNLFVEGFTVSDGRVYTVRRQLTVPPEKRVLTIAVEPSQQKYKPGEQGKVKIRITDADGKPFTGQAVATVYDKSLEYIASAKPGDIKAHFWKWQRQHHRGGSNSISREFGQLLRKDAPGMENIGVFGGDPWMRRDLRGAALNVSWVRASSLNQSLYGNASFNSGDLAGLGARSIEASAGILLTGGGESARRSIAGADRRLSFDKSSVKKEGGFAMAGGGAGGRAGMPELSVRSEFADTAFWKSGIETDAKGEAEIDFPMPDNLTTWKIVVWGMGHGTRVGQGETEVITSKDLLVRLQAPRFFVEKDEVMLSANVHNYLDGEREVKVSLEMDGNGLKANAESLNQTVAVGAGEDRRVNWKVAVAREGEVTLRVIARTADDSDAMEMSFPVYVHGALRTESWSGVLKPGQKTSSLVMEVPKERNPEQSLLEIRYSPSIALTMVDALPYLADYPHKNCESVLNRFVPAVLTQKILQDTGVDLAALRDKATNLNPQEIGDAKERAAQWNKKAANPIYDKAAIDRLVKKGLADLYGMQNSDGGWGWTPRSASDAHTTALVVHGLKLAQNNDLAIVPDVLKRGVAWLEKHQNRELAKLNNAPERKKPWKSQASHLDALVFSVLAENLAPKQKANAQMADHLYRDRLKLSKYSQALFALALDRMGDATRRDAITRNLTQFLVEDAENQSAHLDIDRQGMGRWYWYGNQIETQAAYLKLILRTDPKGDVASGLVKYLLNNRKHATYWHSTRDTAFCLEAIAGYIRATGEDQPNMTVTVRVDGEDKKQIKITPDNLFTFDNVVKLEGEAVTSGKHTVEFVRQGKGRLYYNAYLTTFSKEDFIKKAGLEVKVERNYYRLIPVDFKTKSTGSRGQVLDYRVDHYKRVPLKSGEAVKSGDLVEVELVIDSKNDYEHLLFEDYKPAGFEAVALRSGHSRNGLGAYMELRDERVSFQVRRLGTGRQALTYRLRAEIPGTFSALPAQANGIYAPELRANSNELKVKVTDQ